MSEKKFTAGPWSVCVHEKETTVEAPLQSICFEVSNCDAALIAAAPELLNACESLVNTCDNAPPIDMINYIVNACNEARTAIAKAYGETE